ncbi:putative acetyltransferase [compost metagenome]
MDERVVGFACGQIYKSFCYSEYQAEITEMYVQEFARKNGLALMMIQRLEEIFTDFGVKNIKILTGFNNSKAIKTYEKASYHQEEELVFNKDLGSLLGNNRRQGIGTGIIDDELLKEALKRGAKLLYISSTKNFLLKNHKIYI